MFVGIPKPRSFERNRPPPHFRARSPVSPPLERRRNPYGPQSPVSPGFDEDYFDYPPPAPEVPISPTTTNTYSSQSSSSHFSTDHWAYKVFTQTRSTTTFRTPGQVFVLRNWFGSELPWPDCIPDPPVTDKIFRTPSIGWQKTTQRFWNCKKSNRPALMVSDFPDPLKIQIFSWDYTTDPGTIGPGYIVGVYVQIDQEGKPAFRSLY